ncbi:TIGR04086 family membrane protein [Clostridium algidicarnis]|uniref:TIGR04086 family membrane protein n=2 Tax=Clostridium algidicarnis TaxID=37659 RepID=A0ABS6BZJ1_9CLOT|nr:TIGR04086 family membrane protein [Clostridium algidicarnis]MBB6630534.1 TIGR04086 family membrane protein [Clostridium algidicarnis]MBB6696329.1 TIGR04086 family membrane protein [Clostridium algidicarnis]MBU3193548.1 TIGR04086 family membrane protein [Clostridium algidicarnis]MBU3203046.1 TIGR04086 family membrane protein [Clostridium algidicarnis]MBU3205655.1 TIGR04086 family membrane protein [Clostridium algidicarnis]
MKNNAFVNNLVKGTARSFLLTVIMVIVYSILMRFIDINSNVSSVVYLIITSLSVIYGAIYVARANEKKGWLSGMILSLVYMILIMCISGFMQGFKDIINLYAFYRILIALGMGALSGMLGINL